MNKINWKRKLSSRKFWLAVIGFITPILVIFKAPEELISNLTSSTGLIMSCGTLIAYILSEGFVDASDAKKQDDNDEQ